MGGDCNTIELVTAKDIEPWPPQTKEDVATMLIARIAKELAR
jgi:phosphopantothenoylcysteine decarboxylase/phosphopantothenate--cysteine ligase